MAKDYDWDVEVNDEELKDWDKNSSMSKSANNKSLPKSEVKSDIVYQTRISLSKERRRITAIVLILLFTFVFVGHGKSLFIFIILIILAFIIYDMVRIKFTIKEEELIAIPNSKTFSKSVKYLCCELGFVKVQQSSFGKLFDYGTISVDINDSIVLFPYIKSPNKAKDFLDECIKNSQIALYKITKNETYENYLDLSLKAAQIATKYGEIDIYQIAKSLDVKMSRAVAIMTVLENLDIVEKGNLQDKRKALISSAAIELMIEQHKNGELLPHNEEVSTDNDTEITPQSEPVNNTVITEIEKNIPIEYIDYLSGEEFENFCAFLLLQNGFENVETTKISGDHGGDIIAHKDGIRYAIQCKCYSHTVGNKAIQEAYSAKRIYKADVCVAMTNNYFTKPAQEEAQELNVKLWDRDYLIYVLDLELNMRKLIN